MGSEPVFSVMLSRHLLDMRSVKENIIVFHC